MTSKYKRILAPAGSLALAAAIARRRRRQRTAVRVHRPRDPPADRLGRVLRRSPARVQDTASAPRDVVLSNKAWTDLVRINKWVNENVKPMTDMDHWGVVEKWSYPDDGYGDCEDYALLKRRMLMEAGWPREALLMTVVREKNGNGHAVLTVKTDKGEFILDNQEEQILLWSETSYRFVKRQSQSDPNRWVSLGDPRARRSRDSVIALKHERN